MKCNSCNGLGFYPVTGYQMWMQMDCSPEARRCPVCDGLGATVERLPYQGKTVPTELTKRPEIDVDEYDDIMSWAYGDHPPNQDEGEIKFRWKP